MRLDHGDSDIIYCDGIVCKTIISFTYLISTVDITFYEVKYNLRTQFLRIDCSLTLVLHIRTNTGIRMFNFFSQNSIDEVMKS